MADYGTSSIIYTPANKSMVDTDQADLYKSHYQILTDLHPKAGTNRVVRKIAGWRDPFTLPQSKTECVKECSITPWDKWCCGWAVRWRYMDCELFVDVRVATPQDVVAALEDCLKEAALTAAIAAIVTAYMTGGGALPVAKAAFVASLTECLRKKLNDLIGVDVYQSSGWTDWQ